MGKNRFMTKTGTDAEPEKMFLKKISSGFFNLMAWIAKAQKKQPVCKT